MFGSRACAAGEVAAKIGSFLICQEFGISYPDGNPDLTEDQHAAYLTGWAGVIKDDPKTVKQAIDHNVKTAGYLCRPGSKGSSSTLVATGRMAMDADPPASTTNATEVLSAESATLALRSLSALGAAEPVALAVSSMLQKSHGRGWDGDAGRYGAAVGWPLSGGGEPDRAGLVRRLWAGFDWLLRGPILWALYGLRSERLVLLKPLLQHDLLLVRCLELDKELWGHSTYAKNRDRLIKQGIPRELFV